MKFLDPSAGVPVHMKEENSWGKLQSDRLIETVLFQPCPFNTFRPLNRNGKPVCRYVDRLSVVLSSIRQIYLSSLEHPEVSLMPLVS